MFCSDIHIDRAENGFSLRLSLKTPVKTKEEISKMSDKQLATAVDDGYKYDSKEFIATSVADVVAIVEKYLKEPEEKSPAAEGAE